MTRRHPLTARNTARPDPAYPRQGSQSYPSRCYQTERFVNVLNSHHCPVTPTSPVHRAAPFPVSLAGALRLRGDAASPLRWPVTFLANAASAPRSRILSPRLPSRFQRPPQPSDCTSIILALGQGPVKDRQPKYVPSAALVRSTAFTRVGQVFPA